MCAPVSDSSGASGIFSQDSHARLPHSWACGGGNPLTVIGMPHSSSPSRERRRRRLPEPPALRLRSRPALSSVPAASQWPKHRAGLPFLRGTEQEEWRWNRTPGHAPLVSEVSLPPTGRRAKVGLPLSEVTTLPISPVFPHRHASIPSRCVLPTASPHGCAGKTWLLGGSSPRGSYSQTTYRPSDPKRKRVFTGSFEV